jgi:uncharacterized protein
MKLVFALNHPAHYYLFKYIMIGLLDSGHKIKIVIRQKDILEKLMKSESQSYTRISMKRNRRKNPFSIILNSLTELVVQDINLNKVVTKFKPDCLLGTDIAIAHIGKVRRIPSFVFNEDDYEINKLFCISAYPFADYIVAPRYTSVGRFSSKKIPYNGIQKMAYLNPKYFKPDDDILNELGLKHDEPYFIIRLVSLTSGHDIEGKHVGIDELLLKKIITILGPHGKVLITSEDELPDNMKKYQVRIAPNRMHDLMYYASIFIGDSQSMCAEAGIMGTPFIRFNDFVGKIEYLNDLENRYSLGWGVKTNEPEKIFEIINQLLRMFAIKEEWRKRANVLFKEKTDLTNLMILMINENPTNIANLRTNLD